MFDTMEFIKAVPSRPGRPGVGERFEPYVRIVRNERWISVFHGAERFAKIPLPVDEAGQAAAMAQAVATRDKIVSDFHDAVREHNIAVAARKIAEQSARAARMAMEAAALDAEYGAIAHPPAPFAPPPVVVSGEATEEATPPPAMEDVAPISEDAPTATQIEAPKVAARSVTRRPVRKPAAKPAKAAAPPPASAARSEVNGGGFRASPFFL